MDETESIIPAWCLEIAENIVKTYGPDEAMIIGAFAAALHSERQRCIDEMTSRPDPYGVLAEIVSGIRRSA